MHNIQHTRTETRAPEAHMDDQVYNEVRKKKPHVPTCLQELPLCSFKNREYLRRVKAAK